MDTEYFKGLADHYHRIARGLFVRDGVYFPMLYAIDKDRTLPVGLHEDKREISEIMEAIKDTCDSIILIINMNFIDYGDEKPENLPDTVEDDDPNASQALICFLYTKNESFMRLFRYAKEGEKVAFIEQDWEPMEELSGKFSNPFKKD